MHTGMCALVIALLLLPSATLAQVVAGDDASSIAACETRLNACMSELAKTGLFTFTIEFPPYANRLEQCTQLLEMCVSIQRREDITVAPRQTFSHIAKEAYP